MGGNQIMIQQLKFFFCGCFTDAGPQFAKISPYVKSVLPAVVSGSVYRTDVGQPVYLSDGVDCISGQLVTLEAPEMLFKLLDEFHGLDALIPERSLYFKSERAVETGGLIEKAWIYHLNPDRLPPSARKIENGDWASYIRAQPPLPQRLSERQATYIRKLGSANGRESVRIDLELYRELIKLDLIIDKGRRIALTKLGKDVLRYL
jgi:gamma-glutamylcyclotransferase (GGCT)/AIG2-like uncharacterized protein YtfP